MSKRVVVVGGGVVGSCAAYYAYGRLLKNHVRPGAEEVEA